LAEEKAARQTAEQSL
jgi:hypothetical protein